MKNPKEDKEAYEKLRDVVWAFCKEHGLSGGDRCELLHKIDVILELDHLHL